MPVHLEADVLVGEAQPVEELGVALGAQDVEDGVGRRGFAERARELRRPLRGGPMGRTAIWFCKKARTSH